MYIKVFNLMLNGMKKFRKTPNKDNKIAPKIIVM